MNWYKKSYNREIGHLNQYLKKGFDPYDYTDMVIDYWESVDHPILQKFYQAQSTNQNNLFQENIYETDEYSWVEKWIAEASPKELEDFKEYVKQQNLDPSRMDAPPYEIMDHSKFIKPTWLVHFSDNADDISENGFTQGHDDFRNLAYTTFYGNTSGYSGFNFAFRADDSRDIRAAARQEKYGTNAVVFWGSGVEATHYGDEEDQVIIWGPSVDTNMIFPIHNEGGNWVFKNYNYQHDVYPAVESENIMDVIDWVIQNYTMAKKILGKDKIRIQKHELV